MPSRFNSQAAPAIRPITSNSTSATWVRLPAELTAAVAADVVGEGAGAGVAGGVAGCTIGAVGDIRPGTVAEGNDSAGTVVAAG